MNSGVRGGYCLCVVLCVWAAGTAIARTEVPTWHLREACVEDGRRLEYGFFADFRPVSYSENLDPDSSGFNSHLGYEADLLTALETMEGAGLIFNRSAIGEWPGIWLLPATPRYDLVGGGITILESRTRDATGTTKVTFTSGHIIFRQSLLVRAEDARRYGSYDDLDDARVAVLGGSTGEHRLLQLTGVVDAEGNLAAGTVIHLGDGTRLTADGSADYRITAAASTGNLSGRTRIEGTRGTVREVLIMSTDQEQLDALDNGVVDALARGEVGNHEASRSSNSRFVVTALDPEVEYGGFAFDKDDRALADCIDARINYLTDNRRIGFAEWVEDPEVFLKRARYWNASAEDDSDGCSIAATSSTHQSTLLNLLLAASILFSVVFLRERIWR
ncbi:MAG: amino acid ABC transporter substrate-binding protein [Candidatus Dadabacteria bacterium]|nr:amino acid ABC transporter substrate-binding protein [Candidatus Dadabacteria bacterium]